MKIKESIQDRIAVKEEILNDKKLLTSIEEAVNMIVETLRKGGKIHFCGNGGSAADAQHLAAELSGKFYFDRAPLNAEALHCNSSFLTAVGNDYGYEFIFSRLLEGSGKEGDVLVGLSTSGNSDNIIQAFETAKKKKIAIIAFTGAAGGKMKDYADILLNVPSTDTPVIQENHTMMGHLICENVESIIFKN
ncbi:MAG: SIS domain-containing protein [Bacteroidales bacterium]|jgi:D-sedoheptulose 7-phosphate isomerase|nr:SIS domain-containing protein [Bacteroidales bacterium]